MIKIYQKCDLCGKERLLDHSDINDSPAYTLKKLSNNEHKWINNINTGQDMCSTCNAEYEIWLRERQQENDNVE